MTHFVYRIFNTLNDKTYVGVSTHPAKQISNHFTGSGSKQLYEEVEQYGRGVFVAQVVDFDEDLEIATKKMQTLIMRQNALYPNGYNMSLHGQGSKGALWSGKQRAKVTGSNNHRSKLTEPQVVKIFIDKRPRSVIAKEYEISTTMVTKIKRRKAWTHVTQWISVEEPQPHS